jgi:hypothetical protein
MNCLNVVSEQPVAVAIRNYFQFSPPPPSNNIGFDPPISTHLMMAK